MPDVIEITTDELWPRDEEHRYRLYVSRSDVRLSAILAAAPDMQGIGLAIGTIHEDLKEVGMRFADLGTPGILDTMPDGMISPVGEWIVLPWQRGEETA